MEERLFTLTRPSAQENKQPEHPLQELEVQSDGGTKRTEFRPARKQNQPTRLFRVRLNDHFPSLQRSHCSPTPSGQVRVFQNGGLVIARTVKQAVPTGACLTCHKLAFAPFASYTLQVID